MHHNDSILIGRMAGPCRLKYLESGKAVTSVRLAVQRNQDTTDWFDVILWEKQAEFVTNNGAKGRLLLCQGPLHTRKVSRTDGFEYWKVEMVGRTVRFMDKKPEGQAEPEAASESEAQQEEGTGE